MKNLQPREWVSLDSCTVPLGAFLKKKVKRRQVIIDAELKSLQKAIQVKTHKQKALFLFLFLWVIL